MLRSPCASIQTMPRRSTRCDETSHGPYMGAAAATDDDRPGGERIGHGCALLLQRVALDDGDLRIRKRDARSFGHGLAPESPCRRHAHEPRRERAPAAVALVPVADGHCRERSAVRAARAHGAHAVAFSRMSNRCVARIPASSYSMCAPVRLSESTPSAARVKPRSLNASNAWSRSARPTPRFSTYDAPPRMSTQPRPATVRCGWQMATPQIDVSSAARNQSSGTNRGGWSRQWPHSSYVPDRLPRVPKALLMHVVDEPLLVPGAKRAHRDSVGPHRIRRAACRGRSPCAATSRDGDEPMRRSSSRSTARVRRPRAREESLSAQLGRAGTPPSRGLRDRLTRASSIQTRPSPKSSTDVRVGSDPGSRSSSTLGEVQSRSMLSRRSAPASARSRAALTFEMSARIGDAQRSLIRPRRARRARLRARRRR